jgi:phosphoglycolate phosphatase
MASAVLFDLDGTLLDSLDDLADSMNEVLAARDAPLHDREDYQRFIGDGLEMLVRRALPRDQLDDATVKACMQAMRERYAERWDRKTRPYPGVPELLDALTERGLRLAVLSNKPHDFTCRIVERLLARWRFDPVLGSRPGVPKKPDPQVARDIAGQHGVAPADWLYLGDTSVDMRTACAVGMVAVGVTWGFRDAAELEQAGARHLIDHPSELLKLLE